MARQIFSDNVAATLNGAINDTVTSIVFDNTSGMPQPSNGDYFPLTLFKVVNGVEQDHEVVKVTNNSIGINTLTVERGFSGAAVSHDDGDLAEIRMNAESVFRLTEKIPSSHADAADGNLVALDAALSGHHPLKPVDISILEMASFSTGNSGLLCPRINPVLKCNDYNSLDDFNFTADKLILTDASGNNKIYQNVSYNGLGQLDTGSKVGGRMYYVWLFGRSSDSVITVRVSLSMTNPTVPSGYTYKGLVGVVISYNATNLDFVPMYQQGDIASIPYVVYHLTEIVDQVVNAGDSFAAPLLMTAEGPVKYVFHSTFLSSHGSAATFLLRFGGSFGADIHAFDDTVDNGKKIMKQVQFPNHRSFDGLFYGPLYIRPLPGSPTGTLKMSVSEIHW